MPAIIIICLAANVLVIAGGIYNIVITQSIFSGIAPILFIVSTVGIFFKSSWARRFTQFIYLLSAILSLAILFLFSTEKVFNPWLLIPIGLYALVFILITVDYRYTRWFSRDR